MESRKRITKVHFYKIRVQLLVKKTVELSFVASMVRTGYITVLVGAHDARNTAAGCNSHCNLYKFVALFAFWHVECEASHTHRELPTSTVM